MTERAAGRPPDPRVDAAVASAALVVLSRVGWRGFTFEAVAAEAGVARSTLYRRYGSVQGLMLELMQRFYDDAAVADTGSLLGDLRALGEGVGALWVDPDNLGFVGALAAAVGSDEAIAAAYRAQLERRRTLTRPIVDRARDRGEVTADADADLVLDLLAGFTFQRVLFRGQPLTDADYGRVVDLVHRGLTAGADTVGVPDPRRGRA